MASGHTFSDAPFAAEVHSVFGKNRPDKVTENHGVGGSIPPPGTIAAGFLPRNKRPSAAQVSGFAIKADTAAADPRSSTSEQHRSRYSVGEQTQIPKFPASQPDRSLVDDRRPLAFIPVASANF
jgi:hypothetical protein